MTTTRDRAAGERWRELALCRETDPEAFFPEKGASSKPAKQVCAACPVRAACLADALDRRDVGFGVLGGLSPRERRHLLHVQDLRRVELGWTA